MFIGKWNKSVILTYIGLILGVLGIYVASTNAEGVKYAMMCLMFCRNF